MNRAFCCTALILFGLVAGGDGRGAAGGDRQEAPEGSFLRDEAFRRYRKGDLEKAMELLEEWTAESPDDLESLRTLGHLEYRAGEFAAARSAFESCLALDEDDVYTLFMLGNLALLRLDLAAARGYYNAVEEGDPDYPSLKANRELLQERIAEARRLRLMRRRCDLVCRLAGLAGILILGWIVWRERRIQGSTGRSLG